MAVNVQKLKKWQKQARVIETELIGLLGCRAIYEEYGRIVTNNPEIASQASLFHDWVKSNYATYVAMCIRRQARQGHDDEVTLRGLIEDLKLNAHLVTYEMHRSLYGEENPTFADSLAKSTFNQWVGWEGQFTPKMAEVDINNLSWASDRIVELVNHRIAHTTGKPLQELNYQEVNYCIDMFKDVAERYILLLTADSIDLEPIVDMDWVRAFRKPWIR